MLTLKGKRAFPLQERKTYLISELRREMAGTIDAAVVKEKVRPFLYKFEKCYKDSTFKLEKVKEQYDKWLQGEINFEQTEAQTQPPIPPRCEEERGPRKNFSDLSRRQKTNRLHWLKSAYLAEELLHATASSYDALGKRIIARQIRKLGREADNSDEEDCSMMTPNDAVEMIQSLNLTREQYMGLQARLGRGLPLYHKVIQAQEKMQAQAAMEEIGENGNEEQLET